MLWVFLFFPGVALIIAGLLLGLNYSFNLRERELAAGASTKRSYATGLGVIVATMLAVPAWVFFTAPKFPTSCEGHVQVERQTASGPETVTACVTDLGRIKLP